LESSWIEEDAVVGEALDTAETGLVRLNAGLAKGAVGAPLGCSIAGSEGMAREEPRLECYRQDPDEPCVDRASPHVPASQLLHDASAA
jgi:hypothetical protein